MIKTPQLFLSLIILTISSSLRGQSYVPVVFIVSDFATSRTISNAQVSVRQAGWATKLTDSNGKVSFDNVPVGAINFIVTKDGYQLYEGEQNLSSEVKSNTFKIPLTSIPTTKDKILVTGEVIDKDGRDIEGAWVEVKAANIVQNGLTDKSGNYSIEISLNTGYTVSNLAIEAKKGDCKVKQNVDIPRGNVVYKDIKLDCAAEDEKNPDKTSEVPSILAQDEVNGVRISVTKCELVGRKLICHSLYENISNEPSKWVYVGGTQNKIIDENGLTYQSTAHSVGNVEQQGSGNRRYEIIKGTKVKGRTEFMVGETNFKKLASLEIYTNNGRNHKIFDIKVVK
jgi:hypothetical protein